MFGGLIRALADAAPQNEGRKEIMAGFEYHYYNSKMTLTWLQYEEWEIF